MATTTGTRREYSSNVVRVLENSGTSTNKSSITDVNLDNLLEDLQTSLNRPETSYSNNRSYEHKSTLGDVQHFSPLNSVSFVREVRERSRSPAGYQTREFLSTSKSEAETQKTISQLDSLLQDLKQEREIPREKDYTTTSYTYKEDRKGREPAYYTPPHVTTTKRIYSERTSQGKHGGLVDLNYSLPIRAERSPSFEKRIETNIIKDISYEPVTQLNSNYDLKKGNYSARTVTSESDAVALRDELKNVALSEDILPSPGTKVTTTVRTYTYEVPSDSNTTTRTLLRKNETYSSANDVGYPERDVPPTIVLKTETYKTNSSFDYPDRREPVPMETSVKTLTKRDISSSSSKYRTVPEQPATNIVSYVHTENTNSQNSPQQFSEPSPGPTKTYYYKHESSNTKKTRYGQPGYEHQYLEEGPTVINREYVDQGPKTVAYKYTQSTTYKEPLLHSENEPLISPFPVDDSNVEGRGEQPPKRLDDLLSSLDTNSTTVADEPFVQRREVETAVATGKDVRIASKNIAGPPVYYPPGQEIFARKEEGSAAWRAQGGYAKASGKYEYEADSKSKSKSRSGAAVVPVCLPLCCAMPCSIM